MSSQIDPEDHRGRLGNTETFELGRINRREVRRYARAVEDDNPLFTDVEYAREQGYDDLVIPPNYLSSIIERGTGPPSSDLREDGIDPQRYPIELPPTAVMMGGGQELQFDKYAVAGQEITIEEEFQNIFQRKSETHGTLTFVQFETDYIDGERKRVLRCNWTTIIGDQQ